MGRKSTYDKYLEGSENLCCGKELIKLCATSALHCTSCEISYFIPGLNGERPKPIYGSPNKTVLREAMTIEAMKNRDDALVSRGVKITEIKRKQREAKQ